MSEEAGMAFGNSGWGREGRGCSSWGSHTASSRKKEIAKYIFIVNADISVFF